MYIKVHKSYRTVVAICDKELIGKTFEQNNKQLDCRESFYKGDDVDHDKAVELMKFWNNEDATFNIIGPKSIQAAKEAGIITEEGILKIHDVPYALVLL